MDNDKLYREHIVEAIKKIERYTAGFDFKKFDESDLVQDAVVREIEIIGEAAKHLSAKFKTAYPNVPWVQVMGMRNKLIHEYFGVDAEVVWKTVTEDLQALKKALSK